MINFFTNTSFSLLQSPRGRRDKWIFLCRSGMRTKGLIYGKRDVKNISLRPLSPCSETFEKRPFLTIHEQLSCRNMTAKKDDI